MQKVKHRVGAYVVGTATLALWVTFVTLDLQATKRESTQSATLTDSVYARGVAARGLIAGD
jgi:hypothetical protein